MGCKKILIGMCSLAVSCIRADKPTEYVLRNDSLYLEEHSNMPLERSLAEDPQPFSPGPVMMHMADAHDHK